MKISNFVYLFIIFCLFINFSFSTNLNDNDECSMCNFALKLAEEWVSQNKTEESIVSDLEDACKLFGSDSEDCDLIVNNYAVLIVRLLINNESPSQICTMLELCSKSEDIKQVILDSSDNSSPFCSTCEFAIEFAENYLANNKSEQEIINDLEKVCNFLPNSETCDLVINNYAALIIKLLINNESPSQICSMIELCPKKLGVSEFNECSICKIVTGEVEDYFAENKTQSQVISFLTKDCSAFSSQNWVDTCVNLVETYVPMLFTMLENDESPSVLCGKIGLCSSSSSSTEETIILESNELECPLCTYVASYAEQLLESNSTETEIEKLIQDFCNKLDSKYSTLCSAMVQNYIPDIITMIENNFTPSQICQKFNFCPAPTNSPQAVVVPPKFELDNEIECPLCTYVASYAEQLLASNSTETEIEKLIQDVCNKLDSKYSSICSAMVQNYIPDIITMIENNFTPSQICQKFNFCPAPTNSPQSVVIPPKFELDNEIECPLCTYVASYAEQLLASNSTETEIEKLIQDVCNKLDSKYSTLCTEMVQNYIPDIITMIENNFTPSQICQKFNFCPAPTNSPQSIEIYKPLSPKIDLNGEVECPLCVYIANYTEELLASNKVEQEIISIIQKECNRLPAKYSTMCSAMVMNYVPEIITMIENNWTPDQICEKFKLCIAPSKEEDYQDPCQVCTVLGNYAYQMYTKNATQEETYDNLFTSCKGFPKSWDIPCYDIMQKKGRDLVSDIYEGYSSSDTCNDIGFCSSSSGSSSSFSGSSTGGFSGSSGYLMKFN